MSMISGVDLSAASRHVASSLARAGGNGVRTSATTVPTMKLTPSASGAATAAAAPTTTGTTSTMTSSAGEITSNDFLTLLVTEMKNQDPTQPTDPNAYIQQLVGVNSLQQLISINSELGGGAASTAVPAPTTPTTGNTGAVVSASPI